MANLFGLDHGGGPDPLELSAEEKEANGFDIHAGLSETSRLLFLRPDLVAPGYSQLRPFSAKNFEGLFEVAHLVRTERGTIRARFAINAIEAHTAILYPQNREFIYPVQTQAVFGAGGPECMKPHIVDEPIG